MFNSPRPLRSNALKGSDAPGLIRLIRHEDKTVVVEVDGREVTLTRQLRWYVKPGRLLIDEEVQRWALDELHTMRLSRPILKIGGKPLKGWAVSRIN